MKFTFTFKQTLVGSLVLVALLNGWHIARAATSGTLLRYTPADPARPTSPAAPAAVTKLAADESLVPAPITPANTPVPNTTVAGQLVAAGLNGAYADLYMAAAQATGTPWQLLAAVHHAETTQSDSTSRQSSAGAIGPMQFLPATFARYGIDGNQDGRIDITNLQDAVYSAGNYLAANGAARGNYTAALLAYNHSSSYASSTLATARRLGL